METRAVPASLGSLPHTRPCSVPAPCNQHPSRTFWLRESEARPTGGRKAEGLSSGARSLRKPSLVPAETTSAEGRETEAEVAEMPHGAGFPPHSLPLARDSA